MLFNRTLLIIIVIIQFHFYVLAQWNIKVGYNGGFTAAPQFNSIVNNTNNFVAGLPNIILDDPLDNLKSLHGLEVGIRYRRRSFGVEASWSSISDKSDLFYSSNNINILQNRWFTSMTEYTIGLENYFGYFGYGGAFGLRTLRVKTDLPGSRRKRSGVLEEPNWTSKFYLIAQFPGEKVGIAFKPYVQLQLTDYDLQDFDKNIHQKINKDYTFTDFKERFLMFGISIVLYNGAQ